jgi:hypothetical protein
MEISQQNPSRKHNCGTPPPHQFAIKTQKTGGGQRKKQLTTKKNIEKPNTKKKNCNNNHNNGPKTGHLH